MLQEDAQIIKTIIRATPQSVAHTIVVKKDKDDNRQRRARKRCYARISKKSVSAVARKKLSQLIAMLVKTSHFYALNALLIIANNYFSSRYRLVMKEFFSKNFQYYTIFKCTVLVFQFSSAIIFV